jgi:hypothetical protein
MLELVTRLSLALADYSFETTSFFVDKVATAWVGLELSLLRLARYWQDLELLRYAASIGCFARLGANDLVVALALGLRLGLQSVKFVG